MAPGCWERSKHRHSSSSFKPSTVRPRSARGCSPKKHSIAWHAVVASGVNNRAYTIDYTARLLRVSVELYPKLDPNCRHKSHPNPLETTRDRRWYYAERLLKLGEIGRGQKIPNSILSMDQWQLADTSFIVAGRRTTHSVALGIGFSLTTDETLFPSWPVSAIGTRHITCIN